MVRIVVLAFVIAAGAAAAAVALAAQSPKALRSAIFAAARKQHSVHYVEHGAALGLQQTMVADVAGTRGIQRIRFTLLGRRGEFTVVVVKPTAYLRGNAYALHGYLGFSAAQAARYNGQWISVPPASARYTTLAASVTFPSFLHVIYPSAPLALLTTTIGGRKVTGVRGTNRQPGGRLVEAVFPDAKLRPLSVADDYAGRGFVDALKISRWNEAVHVKAPANAVPISTVQAH